SSGDVRISATDATSMTATSNGLSIDVDLLVISVSVSRATAINDVSLTTDAYIAGSTVTATNGDVTLVAHDDATVTATGRASSVSGAAFPVGVSLSVGGILVANSAQGGLNAYIDGSTVTTVGSGDVTLD